MSQNPSFPSPESRLGSNSFAERLKLIRIACTKRYIYHELAAMLPRSDPENGDIRGDLNSFDLARRWPAPEGGVPDFATLLGSPATFTPPGAPAWNSELSVSSFLGELVLRLRARTVVELGSFVGWTSAHLALALRHQGGGRLHCVEGVPAFAQVARANLERLGLGEWAEFHHGFSLDRPVVDVLPAACDLIFVDTSHRYEDTVKEIATYASRLAPGGCLALHDSIRWGGVRRPIDEVWSRFHVHTFATELGNGLTLLQRRQG